MKKYFIPFILLFAITNVNGQNNFGLGEIHGNFQVDGQYYREDSTISAVVPDQQMALSGFGNLIFTRDRFTAGIRYEAYLPAPVGYPAGAAWTGAGIGYRFAQYSTPLIDVTIGNFYEQFGSGMVLRAWEDRGLGVDYALDGIRVKSNPSRGIYLKGLYGKQRLNFEDGLVNGPGLVRGLDAEINLSQAFDSLIRGKSQIILGGSYVSRYQANTNSNYDFPANVAAYAARLTYINGGFRVSGEYAGTSQNPSFMNSQLVPIPDTLDPGVGLWQQGRGTQFDISYSRKGFGISGRASSMANMAFQSNRNAGPFDSWINYLPPTTVLQTYALSQLYPYATQPNGEVGYRGELFYTIPRGTILGGKYGTKLDIGYTQITGPDTTNLNDLATSRRGVDIGWFQGRDDLYYSELNVKVTRKFGRKFKATMMYANISYDNDRIQGAYNYQNVPTSGTVFSNLFVLDGTINIKKYHNLRFEAQALFTDQHLQDWVAGVLEYTISPHWFFSVVDQWNYGNDNPDNRYHFVVGSAGYIQDGNRISVSYGRQRAGVFCVGGVCRVVPASNGLTLTITSTF